MEPIRLIACAPNYVIMLDGFSKRKDSSMDYLKKAKYHLDHIGPSEPDVARANADAASAFALVAIAEQWGDADIKEQLEDIEGHQRLDKAFIIDRLKEIEQLNIAKKINRLTRLIDRLAETDNTRLAKLEKFYTGLEDRITRLEKHIDELDANYKEKGY